jgi:hypothetical protein
MSDDEEEDQPAAPMQDEASTTGGPIGYGNPPRRHCFAKGVSGNPKGRPKGARGLKAEAAEVLDETFPVNGSRKRVTARKAMLMKQREKAIKQGDARAAALLLGYARDQEDEAQARAAEADRQAIDEQDLALIEAALKRLGKAPERDQS